MEKKVCCPKCKGENVRAVDNQPLYFASKDEVKAGGDTMRYDTELYMTFICDDCNPMAHSAGYFTKIFSLIPKD